MRTHEECPAKGDLKARGFKSPLMDVTGFFHGNVTDQLMRRLPVPDRPPRAPELGWMAAQVDAVFDEMEANPRAS